MPAIKTPPTAARSAIMRSIKARATRPEEALAAALAALDAVPDFRNDRDLPGSPDLVFLRARLAVFVDGAFWHGRAGFPKTNAAWWRAKLLRNMERDREADGMLAALGWRALRLDAAAVLADPAAATAAVIGELP
jgi:DNA mismatch endonuclease (patch repair protein)